VEPPPPLDELLELGLPLDDDEELLEDDEELLEDDELELEEDEDDEPPLLDDEELPEPDEELDELLPAARATTALLLVTETPALDTVTV
jgi:hypothetical protein